ncbi:hypothetical protein EXIGLDRAFT_709194 [Exidia glandulosa HHB12029]|uniref:Uncharacterized protein n=1 Tax=Exidia glandulosa HHB12029 TaxID=1314781 RepID=A0A166MXU5_EXIGL|nr:hypothetical protein EXIGLDRAFT_709194 [Exidia glandulosa HHB12029]
MPFLARACRRQCTAQPLPSLCGAATRTVTGTTGYVERIPSLEPRTNIVHSKSRSRVRLAVTAYFLLVTPHFRRRPCQSPRAQPLAFDLHAIEVPQNRTKRRQQRLRQVQYADLDTLALRKVTRSLHPLARTCRGSSCASGTPLGSEQPARELWNAHLSAFTLLETGVVLTSDARTYSRSPCANSNGPDHTRECEVPISAAIRTLRIDSDTSQCSSREALGLYLKPFVLRNFDLIPMFRNVNTKSKERTSTRSTFAMRPIWRLNRRKLNQNVTYDDVKFNSRQRVQ